jgi:hypothetical protein
VLPIQLTTQKFYESVHNKDLLSKLPHRGMTAPENMFQRAIMQPKPIVPMRGAGSHFPPEYIYPVK